MRSVLVQGSLSTKNTPLFSHLSQVLQPGLTPLLACLSHALQPGVTPLLACLALMVPERLPLAFTEKLVYGVWLGAGVM